MKAIFSIHVIAISALVLVAVSSDLVFAANRSFTRLSREDNAKLQALCNNPEFPSLDSSQFKVFNGTYVPKGKYPWAVVIQAREHETDAWFQQCGGTLISRRHVLTATHCFAELPDYYYRVLVGGVCAEVHPNEGCDRIDMADAPIDFAAYVDRLDESTELAPNFTAYDINSNNDFALIQLQSELPIQLDDPKSTTQAVCLAWPGVEMPDALSVYGWGKTEKGRSASHLMEVDIPVMTPQDPYYKEDKLCASDRFFCQHVAESNKDGGAGDSGSGVVARIGKNVYLFGSTLMGHDKQHINTASRSQKQVIDFCYYTGVCVTKELADKVDDLKEELYYVFNKLYIPK